MKIENIKRLISDIANIEVVKKLSVSDIDSLSLTDYKKILEVLKSCDYQERVISAITDVNFSKLREVDEQVILLNTLKGCSYNKRAYAMMRDENVLKYRTFFEQVRLMKLLTKSFDEALLVGLSEEILINSDIDEQIKLIEAGNIYGKESFSIVLNLFDKRRIQEIIELMKLLSENNSQKLVRKLICSEEVNNNRSYTDIVLLTQKLRECNYNMYAYLVAVDKNVIKNRTCQEQLMLMELLKLSGYMTTIYGEITFPLVLTNRTCEEQINLIKANMSLGQIDGYTCDLVCSEDIIKYRTYDEQLKLINTLYSLRTRDDFYLRRLIAGDIEILSSKSLEEQIEIMMNVRSPREEEMMYEEVIKGISNMKEFREYINYLDRFGVKEVRRRVRVPKKIGIVK